MTSFLNWFVVITVLQLLVGFFFVHFSECVFLNKTKLPAFIKKKELESLLPKHRYKVFLYKKCIDFFCYKKRPIGCQTWKQIFTVFSVLAVQKALLLSTEIERYHRVIIKICYQLIVSLDHMSKLFSSRNCFGFLFLFLFFLINHLTNPSISISEESLLH